MRRIVVGIVVALLAGPVLADDDKPKDKAKAPDKQTPAEQYQALVKEHMDAQQAYFKKYQEAKSQDDKQKVLKELRQQGEKFAPKFLNLAEKHPKDAAAVDALIWVMTNVNVQSPAKDNPKAKAVAILLREHMESDRLGAVCQSLAYNWQDKQAETLLRGVLEKNPNTEVQSEACLALAQLIGQRATIARRLEDQSIAKQIEQAFGKEVLADLRKVDAAKLDAENEALFKQFADKYLTKMKPDRLEQTLQRLQYSSDKGSELVMRRLIDPNAMDIKPEVQAKATLALAGMIKQRAENLPEAEAKDAEKLNKESEELFQRVVDKFANVKGNRGGTLADEAKKQLFELRFLSKGKPAPDIEAEDLDGKQFKLSDYKGKVVLLDFWGNW
jgi:hypothetical protein